MTHERAKKYQTQTQELYALLGKFTAKFELFCLAMKTGIIFLAHLQGLKNPKLMQAITAELTASQLLKAYQSIAIDMPGLTRAGKGILSKIHKRAMALIEKRNDIIHGTWFIGWASPHDVDFSSCAGFKFKNFKQGVQMTNLKINEEEFRPIIAECEDVADLIYRAWGCFIIGSDIEKNFVVNDRTVSVPTANNPEPGKNPPR
jgi:hypothetical protein